MKLRLLLTTFCLLGIGIFSHAQDKKKPAKPTVENGPDAIPITVTSTKKAHKKTPPQKVDVVKLAPPEIVKDENQAVPPPPPPKPAKTKAAPPVGQDGKPLAPPKVDVVKLAPPKIAKDGDKPMPPPPPKPAKTKAEKPVAPDSPPVPDKKAV